jgi:hypothetical protein
MGTCTDFLTGLFAQMNLVREVVSVAGEPSLGIAEHSPSTVLIEACFRVIGAQGHGPDPLSACHLGEMASAGGILGPEVNGDISDRTALAGPFVSDLREKEACLSSYLHLLREQGLLRGCPYG